MFKLQPNPTFWADVAIPVPGSDDEAVLKVEFRHKTKSAIKYFLNPAVSDDTTDTVSKKDKLLPAKSDLGDCMEIVANWQGIDAEFSRETMADLLENYPRASTAIFRAYIAAMLEGRAKN